MCRSEPADQSSWRNACDGEGNLPRCQLCTKSPAYWRNSPTPAGSGPAAADTPLPDRSGGLNWGAGAKVSGFGLKHGTQPCILCGKPSFTVSPPNDRHPRGEHVHKVCAELWMASRRRSVADNK